MTGKEGEGVHETDDFSALIASYLTVSHDLCVSKNESPLTHENRLRYVISHLGTGRDEQYRQHIEEESTETATCAVVARGQRAPILCNIPLMKRNN